jgi:hypothetical protein
VGVSAYDGHSTQTKTPDDSTGGLVVPTRALDFGERLDGRPFSWELPVTNTADQPVEIAGIDTSCNCADVQPREFTLGPGETRALRLDINLHRPVSEGPDQTAHEIRIRATVRGHEEDLHSWVVRGVSRRLLDITPRVFNFNDELREGRPPMTFTIRARPRIPISDLTATGPAGWSLGIRHDGKDYHLDIRPPDATPAGELNESVKLTPYSLEGQELPAIDIPIRGEVVGDVEAVPKVCRMGARALGAVFQGSLTIRSRDGVHRHIVESSAGPEITIDSVKSAEVHYSCAPRNRGDGQTYVDLTVDSPNGQTRRVRATIVYYGY